MPQAASQAAYISVNTAELPRDIAATIKALSPSGQLELLQFLSWLSWRDQGRTGPMPTTTPTFFAAPMARQMDHGDPNGRHQQEFTEDRMAMRLRQANQRRKFMAVAGIMGVLALLMLAYIINESGVFASSQLQPVIPGNGQQQTLAAKPVEPNKPKDEKNFYYYDAEPGKAMADIISYLYWSKKHGHLILEANDFVDDLNNTIKQRRIVAIPRYLTYTVQSGDSLAKIALKQLGRADLWEAIQQANMGQLGTSINVDIGMKVRLPLLKIATEPGAR